MSGPLERLLKDPGNVGRVVAVNGHIVAPERVVLRPQQEPDILDAMFR